MGEALVAKPILMYHTRTLINPSRSRFAPYALGRMIEHGLKLDPQGHSRTLRALSLFQVFKDLSDAHFSRAAVIRLGDEPAAARSALGVLRAHG